MTDWRAVRLVPEVLGALARRYGHFDACEDAVQEALVAAAAHWPVQGWPANPRRVADWRCGPSVPDPAETKAAVCSWPIRGCSF